MKNSIIFCLLALLFWQPLKAQNINDSFVVDYDGYSLSYTIIGLNPNKVGVLCEESPEDEVNLYIPETVTDENGIVFTVTRIEDAGFLDMTFIGELQLPNSIESIGEEAFSGTGIEGTLILGENLSRIGLKNRAFYGTSIESLIIKSQKLTKIGEECFASCKSLKDVTFSNSIKTIGHTAFRSCTKLTELTFPESIQTIEAYAFASTGLDKLVFPSNIESIGNNAFQGCTKLSDIAILGYNLESIGEKAFYNCKKLIKVRCNTIEIIPTLDENAFGNTVGSNLVNADLKIYVPAIVYDDYLSEWSQYENHIFALPTFTNDDGDGKWINENNWHSSTLPEPGENVFINAEAIIGPTDIATVNSYSLCSEGSIIIKEGGQLIHNEGYGEVTMEKKINAYGLGDDGYLVSGWYTISSAFGEMPTNSLLVNNYELFRYNETIYEWENVKNSENNFTTLEPGRGYIYSNEVATTLKISGEPNTDKVVTYNLTAEGELLNGFNLVGNPFTHNIYKGSGASLYNANLTNGYYMLTDHGAWQPKLDTDPILPAQGILVKTSAAGALNINKTTASATRRATSNGLLAIKVSNEKYEDVAYVTFNGGTGLDKIEHRNKNIPMIYVHDANTDYAIAVMNKNVEEIPVHFEHKTLGKYTISVSANDFECKELLLLDNYNGDCVNILEEDYTFLAITNIAPDRFTLKIIPKEDEIVIYTKDNDIIVENISGDALINVYDVSGRIVTKMRSNSNIKISSNTLSKGIYIVNVTDENESKTQKVVVK